MPRSSTAERTATAPVATTAIAARTSAAQASTSVGSVIAKTIRARIQPPTQTASQTSKAPKVEAGSTDHEVFRLVVAARPVRTTRFAARTAVARSPVVRREHGSGPIDASLGPESQRGLQLDRETVKHDSQSELEQPVQVEVEVESVRYGQGAEAGQVVLTTIAANCSAWRAAHSSAVRPVSCSARASGSRFSATPRTYPKTVIATYIAVSASTPETARSTASVCGSRLRSTCGRPRVTALGNHR